MALGLNFSKVHKWGSGGEKEENEDERGRKARERGKGKEKKELFQRCLLELG